MRRTNRLKLFFLLLFILISFYILVLQTEKYRSESNVIIKDLSQQQNASLLGSMLLGESSSVMQDSKLLELYIQSKEMFEALDQEHNLTNYYTSSQIDFFQRLNKNSLLLMYTVNDENILSQYLKDVSILYDEPSNTLNISFLHANPNLAKKIVEDIIRFSSKTLNRFEKENANVALTALITQEQENKLLFIDSIKKLILYQNQHGTIDPNIDVQSKSTILASLESELIQKQVEYKSKLSYLNKNAAEMRLIKDTLHQIKNSISQIKNQIAGHGDNELNKNVSEFELLKSEVDFNKERYKQTLIKLEETKVQVKQNAKNLIIVTQPTLPQTYSEPNKIKDILTLLIIFTFMYGILILVLTLLKEHKD